MLVTSIIFLLCGSNRWTDCDSAPSFSVSNLTIKVSKPWSVCTLVCRAVNCTSSGTAAQATKPVLMERGQRSLIKSYKGYLRTVKSSGLLVQFTEAHLSKSSRSLQFILTAGWCISNEWYVFSPHWNITILWNHLTMKIAGRNELRWLLPAKHQN